MTRASTGLETLLGQIEQAQLVRRSGEPERAYLFKHVLVQDAAYASLLKQDRKHLHQLVGETLERRAFGADRVEEFAPQLAHHFGEAGDLERALKYFMLAGDQAARVYALSEANQHYTRALDLAGRQPVSVLLQEAYLKRGQTLHSSGLYDAAWSNYVEMTDAARQRNDRAMELAALLESAMIRTVFSPLFDPALARNLCEQALTLAETIGERAAEARVLWLLMRITVNVGGGADQAIAYGERALALARDLQLRELSAFCLNDIQYAYSYAGYPRRALEALAEARSLWRELGNLHMLADNLDMTGLISSQVGKLDEALQFADEARRLSHATDNHAHQILSRVVTGIVQTERGRLTEALQVLDEALSLTTGEAFWKDPIRTIYAMAYRALGAIPRGLEQARTAYAEVQTSRMSGIFGPTIMSALAELLIDQRQLVEAQALIEKAYSLLGLGRGASVMVGLLKVEFAEAELELARNNPAGALMVIDRFIASMHESEVHLPFPALYLKGSALLALGHSDEARAIFDRAQREAEAAGARMTLWRILSARSELAENPDEAAAFRRQARSIVADIAEHCPPDLKSAFLQSRDVQSVLQQA
jgi:tetratricopeptide (TPR) repeat protein